MNISNHLFNKVAKAISSANKELKQDICLKNNFTSICAEYYIDNHTSNKISIYSNAIVLHFEIKNNTVNVESNFGGNIRHSADKIQQDLIYMINLVNNIESIFNQIILN